MNKSTAPADHKPAGALTANDVAWAYRLFLNREPESAEIVSRHIAHHANLSSLRASLLRSDEFKKKVPELAASIASAAREAKPLNWPPIKVDVDVSADQLNDMIHFVEGNWELLGKAEPHWSVLTNDMFKAEKIDQNEAHFYESGRASLEYMTLAAARCGLDVSSLTTCLELGCGVGRVTVWLAQHFRSVIGVDISRPHISIAQTAVKQRGILNANFVHINTLQSLRGLPKFDFFYSVIVLQHNPPPIIYAILDALLPKLNAGGAAYFQVPTYGVGKNFNADAYLASAEIRGKMEVHVLPQPALFSLLAKHGCRILEIREDGWTGSPLMISNSLLIQKQA